jgi:hypothetical protein
MWGTRWMTVVNLLQNKGRAYARPISLIRKISYAVTGSSIVAKFLPVRAAWACLWKA